MVSLSKITSKKVVVGRVLYILCLISTATLLGYSAKIMLTQSEKELTKSQFNAITRGSLDLMQENFLRKREAFKIIAGIYKNGDVSWPFVNFPGFEEVGTDLVRAVDGCSMAFIPLVSHQDRLKFEKYAYKVYSDLGFPSETGTSSFGTGIWATDTTLNSTDQRYYFDEVGDEQIYAPILQHSAGATQKFLLMNTLTNPSHATAIGKVMDCSRDQAKSGQKRECAAILESFHHPKLGPCSRTSQPIYASGNNTTVNGFVNSLVAWEKIVNVVDTSMNDLAIVVSSTFGDKQTWRVIDGKATLYQQIEGETEWDPEKTADLEQSIVLNPKLYSDSSAVYTVTIYATPEFCSSYMTNNPKLGMYGSIFIVFLSSIFFACYDYFVRREFSAKKRLLAAKREFMRFISHEVRTPLNSVSMGLTLLIDEIKSSRKQNGVNEKDDKQLRIEIDLCRQIQCNTQSAVDVLNDLLNFDKVEGGGLTLELSVIDIWDIIQTTVAEFELPARLKQINFKIAIPPKKKSNDTKVVGDPIRIIQVVRNLVSNAIKFTPKHGTITITAVSVGPELGHGEKQIFNLHSDEQVSFTKNGNITLSVSDTGAGMTKPQLKTVFKSGVQFNVNKLQGGKGSGLGLFIAKGIVEQHGGSLTVHSDGIDQGTTFKMSLPLYHIPNESSARDFSTSRGCGIGLDPTNNGKLEEEDEANNLRVLVVDDSVCNLKLLSRLISKRGHCVDGAENGQMAVEMVRSAMDENAPYDVICMDYSMPVMDGPTACQTIRKMGCDSFIVGVTGNVLPEDVAHFKSCGANGVLPKPFRIQDMESMWMENSIVNQKELSNVSTGSISLDLRFATNCENMDFDLEKGIVLKEENRRKKHRRRIMKWFLRNTEEPTTSHASSTILDSRF